jgi:hypothetical protein
MCKLPHFTVQYMHALCHEMCTKIMISNSSPASVHFHLHYNWVWPRDITGTGKYKGMLRFKCFNCGGVGNFATKCPHNKNKDTKYQVKFNPNERRKGKSQNNKYFHKKKEEPLFLLAQVQTQGSNLTVHQQTLNIGPFSKTCEADEVSP